MTPPSHHTPRIILADFTNPILTYRIPPARAHPYTSLISLAHDLFNRSPTTHKAHLHFDPGTEHTCRCAGRAMESEWDGGSYFEERVGAVETETEMGTETGTGLLCVYLHFERRSLEEKIAVARRELGVCEGEEVGEEERREKAGRLEREGDERAEMGRWWDAVGWWKRAREVEVRTEGGEGFQRGRTCEDREVVEKEVPELVKDEVQETREQGLLKLVKDEIREILRTEIAGTINITLSNDTKGEIAELVENRIRKVMSEENTAMFMPAPKRQRTSDCVAETLDHSRYSVDHSKLPWPISYPSQITPTITQSQEITTIDTYSNTKFMSRDIIVGRALPSICTHPNIRPLVRATLVTQPQGPSIYTFIPANYHRDTTRNGEIQVALSEVEYLRTYLCASEDQSKAKIRAALAQTAQERDPQGWERKVRKARSGMSFATTPTVRQIPAAPANAYTTIDTYTGSNFENWDIVVGTARPHVCAEPGRRPLVRASLVDGVQVRLYMPARYGVDAVRTKGEIGIPFGGVQVFAEFDAPSEGERRKKIRVALMEKHEGKLAGGRGGCNWDGDGDDEGEGKEWGGER